MIVSMQKSVWLVLLGLLGLGWEGAQAQMVEVPLKVRINEAEAIIEGKVVEKESFWNDDRSMIYTEHVVEVYTAFKGSLEGGQVTLVTRGGRVGNDMIEEDPGLELDVGDTGIFFLRQRSLPALGKRSTGSVLVPYAGPQGFVQYRRASQAAVDPFRRYDDVEAELHRVIQQQVGRAPEVIESFDVQKYLAPSKKKCR